MNAKITSTRKLEITPSGFNAEEKIPEIIFIEDILGLKNEGDSILLVRKNASNLSCLAYLESKKIEPTINKTAESIVEDGGKKLITVDIESLAYVYKTYQTAIIRLCNEYLDKSGVLLGHVREEANKL